MRHIRRNDPAVSVLIVALGLGLTACDNGSSAAPASPAPAAPSVTAPATVNTAASAAASASPADSAAQAGSTAEDESVNEELRDYHRHHHHGGVTLFISMAIDTLGLDAPKKAQVEKIQSDLNAKMAPARDAEHDLLSVIADGVGAGKIDAAKVDASEAKLAAASAAVHGATGDALTQLHDALAPAERAALVEKVKAHWEVWHKVNADEKAASNDKGSRLAKLTELVALTPDQVDKITTALGTEAPTTPQNDPKPVQAYIEAFGTAFVADKFDPKSLNTTEAAAAGHIARQGGARTARFYEAVAPVLTPEQRAKLAAHLRERLDDQHAAAGK